MCGKLLTFDWACLQWLVYILWILAEIAICATDLAEIIGSATALNLLFNIPLWAGVLITAVDVLFIIAFGMKNFRVLEVLPRPFMYLICPHCHLWSKLTLGNFEEFIYNLHGLCTACVLNTSNHGDNQARGRKMCNRLLSRIFAMCRNSYSSLRMTTHGL